MLANLFLPLAPAKNSAAINEGKMKDSTAPHHTTLAGFSLSGREYDSLQQECGVKSKLPRSHWLGT